MRLWSAFTFLALFGSVAVISTVAPETALSQELASSAPRSSLELGPVFDHQAQLDFEQTLDQDERAALIRLKSRYILPDTDCPLPTTNPRQPFILRMREALSRGFADALSNAGVSFVGYVGPNGHILRAVDAAAIDAVSDLILNSSKVLGTYLMKATDRRDSKIQELISSGVDFDQVFHVRFWEDNSKATALQKLSAWGIEVTDAGYEDSPWLDVRADRQQLKALLADTDVEWVGKKYQLKVHNADSTALSNATQAQIGPGTSYNLDGDGMVVGVWDGGVARDTHDAFQGANDPSILGNGTKRILQVDSSASVDSHGTHVTGTIVSDGTGNAAGKGFAPEAYVVSYDWNSDSAERLEARHTYRIVADNHSYGFGGSSPPYGGYDGSTQSDDIDIRDVLLNMCKSAGNDGSGNDTCTDDACMKNSLTIANTSDSGNVSGSSSRGPADDGRLIPHFAANGSGLLSTNSTGNSAWSTKSGTSMSSPSVCGGVTLLAQLWKREMNNRFFAPDVLRGVLATTADDKYNQGPDYRYGFGVVDIKRSADLILSNKANGGKNIIRGSIRQGDVIEYHLPVTSSANPLKVVCSWLDIYASTSSSIVLVNNIDIELVEPNGTTVHYPWSGSDSNGQTFQWTRTAANDRDNIVLAEVDVPATGVWKLRVKGTNIPANPQGNTPNDSTGFVLVSETDISIRKIVVEDSLNSGSAVSIPDNNSTGVTRTINIADTRSIEAVRLYIDVWHTARGNVDIFLKHPDGTLVNIESSDTSTRDDIIAIFPDTRQYDDDVNALIGKSANGNWQVIVTDNSAGDTGEIRYLAIEVDLASDQQAPTAAAGSNFSIREGDTSGLDGLFSTDPQWDVVSYAWTQTSGPTSSLTNPNSSTPTFTAPMVSSSQVLQFQLVVDDGNGSSDSDTVNVTVEDNLPPLTDAGPDFSITEGNAGAMNGSGTTDPEGDSISYQWTEIATNTLLQLFSSEFVSQPTFISPGVTTTITMQLTATDSRGASSSDTVIITILDNATNNAPDAFAGNDQFVQHSATVQVDAGGSTDPENDTLTFSWSQVGGSEVVTLSSATSATPSFTAPSVDATVLLQVIVDDGNSNQDTDQVLITVNTTGTQPPPSSGGGGGGGDDGGGCFVGNASNVLLLLPFLLLMIGYRRRKPCP